MCLKQLITKPNITPWVREALVSRGKCLFKNLTLTVLCALCGLMLPASIQAQDEEPLYPIIRQNKIGYIDKEGRVVIPPQFEKGFIKGFINEGNLRDVQFSEGFAVVNVQGRWGYIDKFGAIVIKPRYSDAWPFSEGLAEVRGPEGKSAYIDKAGNTVVPPVSDMGGNPFSEGLAGVYVGDPSKGLWGFIDKTGAMVIELGFDAAGPFSDGLAFVRIGDKYGFINHEGEFTVPLQNKYIYGPPFREGFAQVWNSEGRGDLIDKSGAVLCGFKYRSISPFSEGLAVVDVNIEGEPPLNAALNPNRPQMGKRAAGFIDKKCQIVIQPRFDYASSFSDGLAVIGMGIYPNIKAGYIDKTGALIIPPLFD